MKFGLLIDGVFRIRLWPTEKLQLGRSAERPVSTQLLPFGDRGTLRLLNTETARCRYAYGIRANDF